MVEDVHDDLGQKKVRESVKDLRSAEVQGTGQQRAFERVEVHRREEVFVGGNGGWRCRVGAAWGRS